MGVQGGGNGFSGSKGGGGMAGPKGGAAGAPGNPSMAYAGGPGFSEMTGRPMPMGGAMQAMGHMYAGGSPGFNEAAGGNGYGGASMDALGDQLMQKRWDGTNSNIPNPNPAPPMQTLGPNVGINQPPAAGAAAGVPINNPQQFTGQNTSGNSDQAVQAAIYGGNQAGLTGAGTDATNAAINSMGAGGGNGWRPGDVAVAGSQAGFNTPAAMFQQGYIDKGLATRGPGGFQWTQAGLDAMRRNSGQPA